MDKRSSKILSEQPLRILMVLHMPWDRQLGGARVQLELSEEFEKMGHYVEKFDYCAAFPNSLFRNRLRSLFPLAFARRAASFVRRHGHRFDVIDAHQANLPFTKLELGFNKGVLLVRSVGLIPFYENWLQIEEKISGRKGTLKSTFAGWMDKRRRICDLHSATVSFNRADLITVPNGDEYQYISEKLGLAHKCRVLPFGLTETRLNNFREEASATSVRQKKQAVVFIGSWCYRKGAADWRVIIDYVRRKISNARFLFLGTWSPVSKVCEDLKIRGCDWIRVVPSFRSDELPTLLADCTVGAFPSYAEGFPFAVLEKLAAGLPTVAYDVPGPRDMLRDVKGKLLAPPGNVEEFADKLVSLLLMPREEYQNLSCECRRVARRYCWNDIAADTIQFYRMGMQNVGAEPLI